MNQKIKLKKNLKRMVLITIISLTSIEIQAIELGIQKPDSLSINTLPTSVAIIREENFSLAQLFRLKDAYRFCNKANFEEDIMWASCSGTVIGKDLVLTAAHCLKAHNDCSGMMIAEGFDLNEDIEVIRSSPEKVYTCAEVIYSSQPHPGRNDRDIAIIKLDRPIQNNPPIKIKSHWKPETEMIYAIGYPSGTPKKISIGFVDKTEFPEVNLKDLEYKKIHLLAPGGLSGGGVFNARHELIGLVVRSETNYIREERCVRDISCTTDACPVTEIQVIDKNILSLIEPN